MAVIVCWPDIELTGGATNQDITIIMPLRLLFGLKKGVNKERKQRPLQCLNWYADCTPPLECSIVIAYWPDYREKVIIITHSTVARVIATIEDCVQATPTSHAYLLAHGSVLGVYDKSTVTGYRNVMYLAPFVLAWA